MRNIIRIFTADFKRIATNVVAVVVIIGLSVIPCLYAWFNILSNWDPYGADATKNLQVAVASMDEGVLLGSFELNVGNKIVSNLKENDSIGWVFVDTDIEAIRGVEAGDYYACLVIEENFSKDMISFLGGEVTNPQIDYYVNEKKNAIAPKITNKVKSTVQEGVNSAFVGTLAEALVSASEYIVTVDSEGNVSTAAIERLEDMDRDLLAAISLLDSYIALCDSTDSIIKAGKTMSEEAQSLLATAEDVAIAAGAAANATGETVTSGGDALIGTLGDLGSSLGKIRKAVNDVFNTIDDKAIAYERVTKLIELCDQDLQDAQISADTTLTADYTQLRADLVKLQELLSEDATAHKDLKAAQDQINSDLEKCENNISTLQSKYNNEVKPQVKATMASVQASITEIQSILNYSSKSLSTVVNALNSYPDMLGLGKETLTTSRDEAVEMEEMLSSLIEKMKEADGSEQYSMLVSLIQQDPDFVAEFISSPVNLDTQAIYEITNNGSAASPFYIVLSIWVGALIMSTILKTDVKPISGVNNPKNYEKFFGRFMVTYLVGQVQTLITVLGALLYVGIQCKHPLLLWFAASMCSFVFSLLLYSFTYSFGNVGEGLSVILMVIQVAGSGGTFPVEVLPKVFQVLYEYMPFMYGMNAMRECIGGFYGLDYWKYLAGLLVYVAVAVFIGLVLYEPCKKVNDKIEKSKENSEVLI